MRRLGAGQVDERRKLLVVTEILDATRFRAEWRGQHYECRGVPGTAGMAVGDLQFGHVLPNNTELAAPCRVAMAGDELWFSPGAIENPMAEHGELWVLREGEDIPEYVWTCPNDWEYITHLAWSKMDDELYMFTYYDDPTDCYVTVWRVNRATRTVTQIVQVTESMVWPNPVNTDPVVDSAQFLDKLYLLCGSLYTWGNIWIFDPAAGTLVHDFHFPEEDGYGGGIATDSGNTICVATDGRNIYTNNAGAGWVREDDFVNLFGVTDCYAEITDWENDICYHGMEKQLVADPTVAERDNTVPAWAASFSDPVDTVGSVALCNLHNEATGALIATFALCWGWGFDPAAGNLWRKDPGGVWVLDSELPYSGGGWPRWAYQALATQSLAQLGGKVHILVLYAHFTGPGVPAADNARVRLFRRESAGNLTQLWETTEARDFIFTHADATGMARAPGSAATPAEYALMRRCHEVN